MKVLYAISERNEAILQIGRSLDAMQIENRCFYTTETVSYFKDKMYQWNLINRDETFVAKNAEQLRVTIEEYQPDVILLVNMPLPRLRRILKEHAKDIPKALWLVDSMEDFRDPVFREIPLFVYDRKSQACAEQEGLKASYCPVGYNEYYGDLSKGYAETKKEIDICFVGTPYKKRLKVLEQVAQAAKRNHWRMEVYGPFFEFPYFWKPAVFRFAYSALANFVKNQVLSSEETAELYARSKIVLNIHDDRNTGTNPRTFEILAAYCMEIIDEREDYDILVPGEDLLAYDHPDVLVQQIEKGLLDVNLRERLAQHGYETVREKRSMRNSLRKILETVKTKGFL